MKQYVQSPSDAARMCYTKKRYPDEALAKKVAQQCEASRGRPLRVYVCPLCGGHHITQTRRIPPPRQSR